ncbi:helix-turn-helix domain-containing protein [Tardiphaga sp.]|jgi:transcriptional regulator with XRE-family HTH domain|uniref:helix-turn-helix domain-containing protein n=1 Tax=Tardiphaga sp. TaxID=1926292 RepID=UPI0037D9CC8F
MTEEPNNIAKIRKRRRMSQQQLADLIGAHVVTISNLERGHTHLSREWAEKIAAALQVESQDLKPVFENPTMIYVRGHLSATDPRWWPDEEPALPVSAHSPIFPYLADSPRWLLVVDDSLYPVFRKGDLVRSNAIFRSSEKDLEQCYDKLCAVTDESDQSWVGFLNRGSGPGLVSLNRISGPPVVDLKFAPSGIVMFDRAIFQPTLSDELKALLTKT